MKEANWYSDQEYQRVKAGGLLKRPLNQDLKGITGRKTEYAKTQKQEGM